jgi:hypothetical protein
MLKIENKSVVNFYNENTFIDFEKANIFLVALFKNSVKNVKYDSSKTSDFESAYENQCEINLNYNSIENECEINLNYNSIENKSSIIESQLGEEKIEMILNKLNPTKEINANIDETICGDFIIKDDNYPNIIIENKITNSNIKQTEIDYFIKSCKQNQSNGIFMSQNTGIIGKNNFEIDIIGSNVIVYIHCVEYDESKIQIAFELLYTLYDKVKLLNIDNQNTISKDVLFEINKEHQLFIMQKEELQKYIKLNQTQMLNQVDSIKFSSLNNFLSTKFDNADKKGIHKCNLCKYYTSNTLKGMAAHKRGCKKKHPAKP